MNITAAAFAASLLLPLWAHAAKPDRSKPPVPGPVPAFEVPVPERFVLSGGLPVYFLPRRQAPIIDAILVVRTGAIADPEGQRGAASATAAMLTRGAGDKTALEFADAVDFLGASLAADASFDSATLWLHVLAEHARDGLQLLADAALRPRFDKKEWQRTQAERRNQFLAWRNDPRVLVQLAVARAMWGNEHRMGFPIMGMPADLERMTAGDLRAFYEARFRPDNAFLVVAGDLDKEQALRLLEETLGGWTASGRMPLLPEQPSRPALTSSDVVLVDKPGAPQTVTAVAGPIKTVSDYDPAARVMTTLLGGSFSSRLNQNLRERNGYTYGAGAAFRTTKQGSTFAASSSVATPVTAPALAETIKEIERMRELASEAEVDMARRFLGLSMPGEFETGRDVASTWAHAVDMGYGEDDVTRFMKRVADVDPGAVKKAAQDYLPNATRIVLVGDRASIEKPLAEANLGPILAWTVDDLLGPRGK